MSFFSGIYDYFFGSDVVKCDPKVAEMWRREQEAKQKEQKEQNEPVKCGALETFQHEFVSDAKRKKGINSSEARR